jgi:hypothetical protein
MSKNTNDYLKLLTIHEYEYSLQTDIRMIKYGLYADGTITVQRYVLNL